MHLKLHILSTRVYAVRVIVGYPDRTLVFRLHERPNRVRISCDEIHDGLDEMVILQIQTSLSLYSVSFSVAQTANVKYEDKNWDGRQCGVERDAMKEGLSDLKTTAIDGDHRRASFSRPGSHRGCSVPNNYDGLEIKNYHYSIFIF